MSIQILKAGVMDSLQDEGRFGFAKWGINVNGAMDPFSMRIANALVGNNLTDAVIELHFPSSEFKFTSPALISLTGADFTPAVNGQPISPWKPIQMRKGSVLTLQRQSKGMRCYLAMHGGFDVPEWLGSASTNVKAHAGGFLGRTLKRGDTLQIKPGIFSQQITNDFTVLPWSVNVKDIYEERPVLFLRGHEWHRITPESQNLFLSQSFSVSPSSDRMASFLSHEPFSFSTSEQLLSSAAAFGTIQALPSGKLCVLMADHQTTGGYPRVGHIITADLPRFAQISPGEKFSFKETTIAEAEKMLFSLHERTSSLAKSLLEKLQQRYANH